MPYVAVSFEFSFCPSFASYLFSVFNYTTRESKMWPWSVPWDQHCSLGQKLAINVSALGPRPSLVPTPPPRGPNTYTIGDDLVVLQLISLSPLPVNISSLALLHPSMTWVRKLAINVTASSTANPPSSSTETPSSGTNPVSEGPSGVPALPSPVSSAPPHTRPLHHPLIYSHGVLLTYYIARS
ncbi:hypothetical protein REPUB_Repub18cG0075700 [Reevesia pubescens]